MEKKGIKTQREVTLPVQYEEMIFETGFRADLIVEEKILIEIKSIEKIQPIHKTQILTYLKLAGYPVGLLINFGETLLKNGIHRFANGEGANDL